MGAGMGMETGLRIRWGILDRGEKKREEIVRNGFLLDVRGMALTGYEVSEGGAGGGKKGTGKGRDGGGAFFRDLDSMQPVLWCLCSMSMFPSFHR